MWLRIVANHGTMLLEVVGGGLGTLNRMQLAYEVCPRCRWQDQGRVTTALILVDPTRLDLCNKLRV